MADVKWIKISTGMFSESRKIRQIELMPEGDTVLVIWVKLLLLAGQINDGGAIYITPEIPYTEEMLALELCRPVEIVKTALQIFSRFGMIRSENSILYLNSWEKYQNTERLTEIRAYNREAKRRSREKLKALKEVNDMSMTSQRGHDTEKEIDIDKEKEEEKERGKEFQSFAHSRFEVRDASSSDVANAEEAESRKRQKLGGKLGRGVVMLSEEQMDKLLEVLSQEEFDYYVSVIAENELNGKHYKRRTHYQAILDMAEIDRKI